METSKIRRTGIPALEFPGMKLTAIALAVLALSLASCDFNGREDTGRAVYPIDDGTPLTTPPTSSPSTCQCTSDLYDCGDFSTHDEAQACFDYCRGQGKGDVHHLDEDKNGLACE